MSHGDLYDAIFDDEAYSQLPAMVAAAAGGRSCTLYHFHPIISIRKTRFPISSSPISPAR